MKAQAKEFLSNQAESVVKQASVRVEKHHGDAPGELQFLFATEYAQGKLSGMYAMFVAGQDEEPADGSAEDIKGIVEDHYDIIVTLLGIDLDDI